MSLVSSNPQELAVKALNDQFGCDKSVIKIGELDPRTLVACKSIGGGFLDFGPVTLGEIVDCLAEAGLLVTPQASSAERSEDSLVSAIAESLRDFQFHVGPNTREALAAGKPWVYLTANERHEIAHAAVNAHKQVTGDE